MALRTSRSIQARNAARVFPEPVGAQISADRFWRMWGQPNSCGSVGVPNLLRNQARTSGCAQSRAPGSMVSRTERFSISITLGVQASRGSRINITDKLAEEAGIRWLLLNPLQLKPLSPLLPMES